MGLTTAIPDNQVPAFLQVDGQQVGKGAGQVTQAVVCFLQSLKTTKESVTHLLKQIINQAGVLPVLQRQSPAIPFKAIFYRKKKIKTFPRLYFTTQVAKYQHQVCATKQGFYLKMSGDKTITNACKGFPNPISLSALFFFP